LIYGVPLALLIPTASTICYYDPSLEEFLWNYLIWTIENLGPTFIKFAQWASTRPDLYPPKLVEKLIRFQDDVKIKNSMARVENTLTLAFGASWKEKLELDPNPIGAGCVAQVYRGKLKRNMNGKMVDVNVAVKLIHPHVESIIRTDMEILTYLSSLLDLSEKWSVLSFGDTCRQFADSMKDQLDLRIEAKNLKKFSQKFAKDDWALFPEPIEGFISKNVVVETLMDGIPLQYYTNQRDTKDIKIEQLRLKLSDLGVRAVVKMIFFDNFIHGDLHPGAMHSIG
jgi:aarF domain-containing kinase